MNREHEYVISFLINAGVVERVLAMDSAPRTISDWIFSSNIFVVNPKGWDDEGGIERRLITKEEFLNKLPLCGGITTFKTDPTTTEELRQALFILKNRLKSNSHRLIKSQINRIFERVNEKDPLHGMVQP